MKWMVTSFASPNAPAGISDGIQGIATVHGDPDMANAHARLIAEAPVLLDCLRRLIRHIPNEWGGCSLSDDLRKSIAAIDRATSKD